MVETCGQITSSTTNNYPGIYQVTLLGGGIIKIQNGIVKLPIEPRQPLVNNTFCAELEIPVGGSLTAELLFKGYGAVVIKGIWRGISCLLFSARVGTT
ncbi:MAG: hypothetical protein ACJATI_004925 [Halioglobus sp.]|jgi:hypothetical protein